MPFTYDYPRPAVSVDMVVVRSFDGEQNVLLIQRRHEPFENQWALPGGFMDVDETLESAAKRELSEETGLIASGLTQIGAFSAVDRDPRYRVVSVAFRAVVDDDQQPHAGDDAKNAQWFPVARLPSLAFDHGKIIARAVNNDAGND